MDTLAPIEAILNGEEVVTLELLIPENAPVVVVDDVLDEDEDDLDEDEDEHSDHDEDEHSDHDEDEHSDHDEDEMADEAAGPKFGADKETEEKEYTVVEEELLIVGAEEGAEEGEDGASYLAATSTFLTLLVGSTLFL